MWKGAWDVWKGEPGVWKGAWGNPSPRKIAEVHSQDLGEGQGVEAGKKSMENKNGNVGQKFRDRQAKAELSTEPLQPYPDCVSHRYHD